jgi:hypothetical protein
MDAHRPMYSSDLGMYGVDRNAATSSGRHPLKTSREEKKGVDTTKESSRPIVSGTSDEEDKEDYPLLPKHTSLSWVQRYVFSSRKTAVKVAAYFLMDYEASHPPTLQTDFESITKQQLTCYRIHFSWAWRCLINFAILLLFVSHTQNMLVTAISHSIFIVIFAIEIYITEKMYGIDPKEDTRHGDRKLVRPMIAFLFFLGLESWMWYFFSSEVRQNGEAFTIFCSIFKPLVFFYASAKARDSLEALWRISRIVVRVLVIEFFLILTFAAVGCRMFGKNHESFHSLTTSWLSLFECTYDLRYIICWVLISWYNK